MDLKETEVGRSLKYDGEVVRVEQLRVRLANGELANRDVVYHAPAVAMLVVTNDDKMVLERQWRMPANQTLLEIPAGKLDDRDQGEPLSAVERELNEELRLHAQHVQLLSEFYTSCGFTDEFMYLYLVTELEPVTHDLPRDQGEFLELQKVSLPEALQLVADHQIKDAKTIMAIQAWRLMKLQPEDKA
ncbi:ADP-ribose pyrophosphatase [Fructilactobacillus florum 8D]|uniref:ADP-ribose pyrophosphatase n=2 Tax=Fructilactobacillus florum TaxID=640331 RepID=W9ECY9_9LACO|nr:NUDIX hydrolase [Fructilactobacillus florum]EKK20309.1 ADP-ribose pyrophosphatase [Fructilactobacillus florum 2F]ETO39978.1 ADP-ribose pyrophosphatase [Fructilactobacillus florum 8D]KRM91656.1 ADP-ribose pyrophosphatase [Fructilactobacillus florum DSM 22689 = JCM 16035]